MQISSGQADTAPFVILASNKIRTLLAASNNTLWVGYGDSGRGLTHFDDGVGQSYLTGDQVQAIAESSTGNLWVGAADGLAYSNTASVGWQSAPLPSEIPSNQVPSLVATQGRVWMVTADGIQQFDGATWQTYTTADGLAANSVTAIAIAPDGRVWIATAGGLSQFKP